MRNELNTADFAPEQGPESAPDKEPRATRRQRRRAQAVPAPANDMSDVPLGGAAPTPDGFTGLAVFTADWDIAPADPKPHATVAATALDDLTPNETASPAASGPGPMGWTAAGAWLATSVGAPLAYWGADAIAAQHPALIGAMGAIALFPAVMILFGSSAARDAARARAEARRAAALATQAFTPNGKSTEVVRAFGDSVRGEINALESVVDRALGRLQELENATARHRSAFGETVREAESSAGALTTVFARELANIEGLNHNLREQTDSMGQSVSRQIRLMREASRIVSHEVQEAEASFEQHLGAFTAVASVIGERTSALQDAQEGALTAASALDHALGQALSGLTQATQLTEASRQSVETSAQVAEEAATALRDGTDRALAEARRTAQLVRAEVRAMQDEAADVFARLQEAAQAAHAASEAAQDAADKQAATIQRRLSVMAETAVAQRAATVQHNTAQQTQAAATERRYAAAAGAARANSYAQPAAPTRPAPRLNELVNAQEAANDSFRPAAPRSEPRPLLDALAEQGVRFAEALNEAELEEIAIRARAGAAARRKAVRDIAPTAVERVAQALRHNQNLTRQAYALRRDPQAAAQTFAQRWSEAEITVAYLLVDASLD